MSLFSYLFSSKRESESPAWNQDQREALVDLLYLAIYVDNHLSLLEELKVEQELKQIEWEGPQSSTLYVNDAIKRARDAKDDTDFKERYLKRIADRLGDKKPLAAEALRQVISADGTDPKESAFLADVQSTLAD